MKRRKHPLLVGLIVIVLSGLVLGYGIGIINETKTITIFGLLIMVVNTLLIIYGILMLLETKEANHEKFPNE